MKTSLYYTKRGNTSAAPIPDDKPIVSGRWSNCAWCNKRFIMNINGTGRFCNERCKGYYHRTANK